MRTTTILVPALVAAAFGLAACDVKKTQEGNVNLPKYDVQKTQEGNVNLPKYDVKGPDVQVSKEEKTVNVPTVKTEEKSVTLPKVEVQTGGEKRAEGR